MSTLKTISAALNLIGEKKENLKKALDDLQSQSSIFSNSLPLSWPHLDSHFTSIQTSLTQRFHLLEILTVILNDLQPSPSNSPPQTPNDYNLTPLPNDPSTQNVASDSVFPRNCVVPISIVTPTDVLTATIKEEPPSPSKSPNQTPNDANFTPIPNDPSIVIRHELSALCAKMDGKGLMNYLNTHQKVSYVVQAELPGALRCAADPAEMVVESLERYHRRCDKECEDNVRMLTRKGWTWLTKCCSILLKQLRVVSPSVSWKARERALKVAREWKIRMLVHNVNYRGAMCFLHFVTIYGLVSEINVDEYIMFSIQCQGLVDNKEFPELCQIPGLADRVPDIIQKLIETGKHILAVKYICEFNLVEKIPPFSILKAFMDVSMKLSERLFEEGKSWTVSRDREIGALESVINIIEKYKLEFEYPRASLDQRIEELKSQKSVIKGPAPASDANPPHPPQDQQQLQKNKKQKLKHQQGGIKHPQTTTPVGSAAALKNVHNGNSTVHQHHQHPGQSTGVFSETTNPPQDQQQPQLQKSKKQKLKQQQGEIKHPQTTTPVGPAAALKNVHNGNSTVQQQHQHPGQSTGVFSETTNPPQDQQQLQKTKKQKLKQQQSGIKHPQTTTPVGPAAALKNVHNGNSTVHQHRQHPGQSTGVFSETTNPPQDQQQQQLEKSKKQKLKQQQGEIKHPQTTTPVGPAAALINVHNGNSTVHQHHQHPGQSTGVFTETTNPPQDQQQQQLQKTKKQKLKQQQGGIKHPQTTTPVGPAAALKNVHNGNSTVHQHRQHPGQSNP